MKPLQNSINVILNTLAGAVVDISTRTDGRAIVWRASSGDYTHVDFPAITFEALLASGDVGTGADQVAYGNHVHTALYIPYIGAIGNADMGAYAMKASKFQLKTDAVNTLATGEFGWDIHDKTISIKSGNVTLQVNQEQVLPVKNMTGSTLLNGRLVRISGHSEIDEYYTAEYADNALESTAYVDFMLTEDIPNGSIGIGTKTGLIHDLNTTGFSTVGLVYLGTNGQFVATEPTYPNRVVVVGTCGHVHATVGEVFIDLNRTGQYNVNTLTREVTLKSMQNPGICQKCPIRPSDITINTTTRVLTIATINGGQTITPANPIRFFTDGAGIITMHEKPTATSFPAFTDTTGIWYFYFDSNGDPITTQSTWSDFNTIATVYRLYWNATLTGSAKLVVEAFEAHINDISASDHAWKHALGSIYERGLDITHNAISTGAPNADGRNTVISLSTGTCSDDGLEWTVTNTATPVNYFEQNMGTLTAGTLTSTKSGLFKIRTNSAAGLLDFLPATRFPFLWNTGNNRPRYLTTTGVATDVPDDNFFIYYVYNLADRGVGNTIKIVSAETTFSTIESAQAHSWETLRGLYSTLKDNEIRPLYKLIFYVNHTNPQPYDVACKYSVLRYVIDIRKQSTTASVASAGSVIASNVVVSPTGTLSATNAQAAFTELDDEKIPYVGALRAIDFGINNLTVDTNTLFVDSVNHRLGFGTLTPGARVSLGAHTPSNYQSLLIFENTNTKAGLGLSPTDYRMFAPTGSDIVFGSLSTTDGTSFDPKLTIKASGAVIMASLSTGATTLVTASTTGQLSTTANNSTNWDTAFTQTRQWNGGSTGLVAATGRTSLGATTVGSNLFTLTNPSAVTFLRINADNTVSTLDAATFRTAIGAGTSSTTGTVTSVAALTLGTTGTDLSSTVATGTTTPVITLNVPTASAANRGVLSAADWTTFNNKTSNTGTVTSVSMSVPTGLTIGGSPITTTGTLALTFTAGYSIPTTANQTNWGTAYTYSQVGHLPLAGGTMSNTTVVTNMNADLLDGQHGSYYAVAIGSTNYIQNQNASAQGASMWISNDIRTDAKARALQFSLGATNDVDANGSVWYGLSNRNASGVDLNGYFGLNFNVATGNALSFDSARAATFASTVQATTATFTTVGTTAGTSILGRTSTGLLTTNVSSSLLSNDANLAKLDAANHVFSGTEFHTFGGYLDLGWAQFGANSTAVGSISYNSTKGLQLIGKIGSAYDFAINTPSSVTVLAIPTGTNNVNIIGTVQATTAKLTNLTDGYIPYHLTDATGLTSSPIYVSGSTMVFNQNGSNLAVRGGTATALPLYTDIGSEIPFIYHTQGTSVRALTIGVADDVVLANYLHLYEGNSPSTAFTSFGLNGAEKMRLGPDGKLGVNTATLTKNFNVKSTTLNASAELMLQDDGSRSIVLKSPNAVIFLGELTIEGSNSDLALNTRDYQGIRIKGTSGNVGIGTATPQQKLDVAGKVAISGLELFTAPLVTGSAGTSGYVLTSTGSTTAPTWQPKTVGTLTSIIAGTGLSGGTITTSGTIAVNYGSTSTTACVGNDSRLSDTRTPTDTSVTYTKVANALKTAATVTSTVDLSANGIGNITLSANTAFTFTGYELNKTYMLVITANGFTPSWAVGARHIPVTGNESFGTTGVYYVSLTCIDATASSEKLLTVIMKGS